MISRPDNRPRGCGRGGWLVKKRSKKGGPCNFKEHYTTYSGKKRRRELESMIEGFSRNDSSGLWIFFLCIPFWLNRIDSF